MHVTAHTRPATRRNLPVGVLFDLFGLASSLPWRVVVHLQRIPSDEVRTGCNPAADALALLTRAHGAPPATCGFAAPALQQ